MVSLIYSYKLKWLGDDIFIVFRYVQNFVAGNGLVYNVGEKVEGYTDFLWTMILCLFAKIKFSPLNVSQLLGIISSLSTLVVMALAGNKIAKQRKQFLLPFITISLAINYDYNVWATSGLETSFYTFLMCMAFYTFFFAEMKEAKRLVLTGLYLSLAIMSRPDGLLVVAVANALLVMNYLLNKTTTFITSFINYLGTLRALIHL